MKKTFLSMLMAIAVCMTAGTIVSCNGCGKGEPGEPDKVVPGDYDGVVQDFTAGVEHIIALHRETVFSLYDGERYAWYEAKVLFSDSLKLENIDSLYVTDVTDVFQLFDPARCQFISTNIKDGTIIPKPIADIWIEDVDMSNSEIRLTVDDVLERLKAWDGILPPAVGMTLRQPLGPLPCNPQYVIGNIMQVIFVDAVTGDISDWCPAFPRE